MADFVHPKDERGPLIYMALMLSTFLLLSQRGSPLRRGRPGLRQGPLDRHRAAVRRPGAQDAARQTGTSLICLVSRNLSSRDDGEISSRSSFTQPLRGKYALQSK